MMRRSLQQETLHSGNCAGNAIDYQLERSYGAQLQQYGREKDLPNGKRLHSELSRHGYDRRTFLGTLLVQMYGSCGCVHEALFAFEKFNPSTFSWNVLVAVYSQNGDLLEARKIFDKMQSKDAVSWNTMITAHTQRGHLHEAMVLFEEMPHRNVISWNAMVTAYAQNGRLEQAKDLFDRMTVSNVISWNTMIAAYAQKGYLLVAWNLFEKMSIRNLVTWNILMGKYAQHCLLKQARSMFNRMPEWDDISWNSLISGYSLNRQLQTAKEIFDTMPHHGLVSWTAIIQAYTHNGHLSEALHMFKKMPYTNLLSWTAIATAYAQSGCCEQARKIYDSMPDRDVFASNAMIAGYALNGHIQEARNVFDEMPSRDIFSWNGIIATYTQNGETQEGFMLFRLMDLEGIMSDRITFLTIVDACASLSSITKAKVVHAEILANGVAIDVGVVTPLVNMYGKCGRLETARKLYDEMSHHVDVALHNAMITAYAQNGQGRDALDVLKSCILVGVTPDSITFISSISACSHAGFVRDGHGYFLSFVADFGLAPRVDQYTCMVDLLSRTGKLADAEDLMESMPFIPETIAWRSLLSACKNYDDIDRGIRIATKMLSADADNPSAFVLLANIYGKAGRFRKQAIARKLMKDMGLKKPPACSSIVIRDKVHVFMAGDMSHAYSNAIFSELRRLGVLMREAGYVPDTSSILHDLEEEEKKHALNYHSEKIAIAFGILSTPPSTYLHIVKNLRVCADCHAAIKFISVVSAREIVVRDSSRFHHFKNGKCSCGDFW